MTVAGQRCAFIDRDGVINEERHYVHKVEDFVLLPGAVQGLRLLQDEGWCLVVVTNQAGIARGLYTEAQMHKLHQHMRELLQRQGVQISAVMHCPHHPQGTVPAYTTNCNCRKPQPGLLLQAARELEVDLGRSALVGDKRSDIEAGLAAGLPLCVAVHSGHALDDATTELAHHTCSNLYEAARWIVQAQHQAVS